MSNTLSRFWRHRRALSIRPALQFHKVGPLALRRLGPYAYDTGWCVDSAIVGAGFQLVWFGIRAELVITKR